MSDDILSTITPKSDQLNADSLVGGRSLTIKIVDVVITPGDQPVAIHFEGDDNKPYKPGKSMRRVLVNAWGPNIKSWVGRRAQLYRDDHVVFGGVQVGGIRIAALSDIKQSITMALTATRSSRKPFTVEPLSEAHAPEPESDIEPIGDLFALIEKGNEATAGGMLKAFWASLSPAQRKAIGAAQLDTWKKKETEEKT